MPATRVNETEQGSNVFPVIGGRLSLASGVPVMTSSISASGTVYFTPYIGGTMPVWLGSLFGSMYFTELSQALSDTTKSPSAAVANALYDFFVWNDAGTPRLSRGPTWTSGATAGSNTTRGSGAGSTAIYRPYGLQVNQYDIANGPKANYGVFVGTGVTDASGATMTWLFGTAAANGGGARFGLWNNFNRRPFVTQVSDTTASWPYALATVRAAHGSSTFRVTLVSGLPEDAFEGEYSSSMTAGSAGYGIVGVGIDTTTAFSGPAGYGPNASAVGSASGEASSTLMGLHYVSANEMVNSANTQTFFGQGAVSGVPASALVFRGHF